jgi:hypothetical protein
MRWWVGAAFALTLATPGHAIAAGAVMGRQGETVTLSTARVAVAAAPGRTTSWTQVSVSGAGAGFVWIMPARPGARVDLGSDAWLDALDAATSPVVIPPSAAPGSECDTGEGGAGPEFVPPLTSPQSTRPTATAIFTDTGTLGAFVSGAGYALPHDLAAALGTLFASGSAVVASTYATAELPTRTLRIVDDGPPLLPFALSGTSASDTPVTVFVIASGAATAGASPLALDPSTVLWEGDGMSTYLAARSALLTPWQGTRWLTESALPGLLFDGVPVGPEGALPSVLGAYFQLASAYGDAAGDPASCTAAADATQAETEPYASLCPEGALGVVAGSGPCATSDGGDGGDEDGGAGVDALVCGGSSYDAAFAVASLVANDIWVTRIDGRLASASATDVPLSLQPLPPTSPVVVAAGYASACDASTTAAPPLPPYGSYGASPSSPSTGSSPASSSASSPSPDVGTAVAEGCGAGLADGCGNDDAADDGGDAAGACDPDAGGDDCAAGARGKGKRRSPVSRVVVLLVALSAAARRRSRRPS